MKTANIKPSDIESNVKTQLDMYKASSPEGIAHAIMASCQNGDERLHMAYKLAEASEFIKENIIQQWIKDPQGTNQQLGAFSITTRSNKKLKSTFEKDVQALDHATIDQCYELKLKNTSELFKILGSDFMDPRTEIVKTKPFITRLK